MFRLDDGLKVYLHREAVDFRKNINGRKRRLITRLDVGMRGGQTSRT